MAKTIITPVGTSIFTNYMDKDDVVRHYNISVGDYEAIEVQCERLEKLRCEARNNSRYESDINYIRERIRFLWLAEAKEKASAELQTLFEIARTEKEDLVVHLLATDTVLSVVACELIQEWLGENENAGMSRPKMVCHYHFNTHVVRGLQVEYAAAFQSEGFQNLLVLIQKFKKPNETIINISGGYKAIIPFVALFAQLEEIPLKYLYEDSSVLITVGNLPFTFDYTFFTDEFVAFESIKPGKDVKNLPTKEVFTKNLSAESAYQQLADTLLIFEKEGKIHLSELGKILYQRYEAEDTTAGFKTSNLLGKVMEVKVFEFFQRQFPTAQTVMGKGIGQSAQGDPYDLDVFVENDDAIWAIEVKPQNVAVLIEENMKETQQMKTIEYKCLTGAFRCANEQYADKQRNIAVVMYHHIEPNTYQVENFSKLKTRYDNVRWLWLKPPDNYKGNVNWTATQDKFKEFDFKTRQWIDFNL